MSAFGGFGARPAATNLFGQAQPATTSGFGSFGQQSTATQQQSATGATPFGTGFGQPAQNIQPSASPFGTFGTSNQTQNAAPSGGMGGFGTFGQGNPASTTAPGTSTFGNSFFSNANTQQQQAQNNAGAANPGGNVPVPPSLFGATGAGNNTASTSTAPQQPAAATSTPFGLFGSTSNQTQTQQPQNQQSQAGSSFFGSSLNPGAASTTTRPMAGAFGGSTFGQPAAGASSSFPSFGAPRPAAGPTAGTNFGQSTPTAITKNTKFNDLPSHVQQHLEKIQSMLQSSSQISSGLKARQLGDNAKRPLQQLEDLAPSIQGLFSTTISDEEIAQDLRSKLDQAIVDGTIATQIIEGFQDPNKATYLQTHAGFPLEYYSRLTDQLAERLEKYKNTIDVIERKLISVTEDQRRSPQSISSTLRVQHATFTALAARTAELDAAMKKIRERTVINWRAQTGSSRDPFDEGLMGTSLGGSVSGNGGGSRLGRSVFGN